jgi:hypothetical protein
VSSPFGDLGGRDTTVEPRGYCGVSQVVWPLHERCLLNLLRERCGSGSPEYPAVGDLGQFSAMLTSEQSTFFIDSESSEVLAEQYRQLRRARRCAPFTTCPVFELAPVASLSPISPFLTRMRR